MLLSVRSRPMSNISWSDIDEFISPVRLGRLTLIPEGLARLLSHHNGIGMWMAVFN